MGEKGYVWVGKVSSLFEYIVKYLYSTKILLEGDCDCRLVIDDIFKEIQAVSKITVFVKVRETEDSVMDNVERMVGGEIEEIFPPRV